MLGRMEHDRDEAPAAELTGAGVVAVVVAVIALLVLMVLGLAVRGVAQLLGTPLPMMHDDPNRIDWVGLAELAGYGVAGAIVLYGGYELGSRVLPEAAQRHVARLLGVAALLVLAASGAYVAIDRWDLRATLFALACGYGAYRVARGLPLDDEDDA
jgi:hypothetical protein